MVLSRVIHKEVKVVTVVNFVSSSMHCLLKMNSQHEFLSFERKLDNFWGLETLSVKENEKKDYGKIYLIDLCKPRL